MGPYSANPVFILIRQVQENLFLKGSFSLYTILA